MVCLPNTCLELPTLVPNCPKPVMVNSISSWVDLLGWWHPPLSPIIQNLGSHPHKFIILSTSFSFLLKSHQLHPLKSSEIYPFLFIILTLPFSSSASLFTLIIARASQLASFSWVLFAYFCRATSAMLWSTNVIVTLAPDPFVVPNCSLNVVQMPQHGGGGDLVAKFYLTLQTPWSPPGSSVHGISQARILEWFAISFSRRSSWPKDPALAGRFLTVEPPGKPVFITWV